MGKLKSRAPVRSSAGSGYQHREGAEGSGSIPELPVVADTPSADRSTRQENISTPPEFTRISPITEQSRGRTALTRDVFHIRQTSSPLALYSHVRTARRFSKVRRDTCIQNAQPGR